MNRINETWKDILEMANKDLEKSNAKIETETDEDGYYSVYVTKNGKKKCYADGNFEDELGELINEAWAHAKAMAENKPRKVWVIHFDDVADYATLTHDVEAYDSLEKARARFCDIVWDAKQDTSWGEGWIEDETNTSYETYPDGEWGTDHYAVYIEEVEVK